MKKKYLVYEILFSGGFLLMANFSCYFIILILYQTLIQKEKKIYIYIYAAFWISVYDNETARSCQTCRFPPIASGQHLFYFFKSRYRFSMFIVSWTRFSFHVHVMCVFFFCGLSYLPIPISFAVLFFSTIFCRLKLPLVVLIQFFLTVLSKPFGLDCGK